MQFERKATQFRRTTTASKRAESTPKQRTSSEKLEGIARPHISHRICPFAVRYLDRRMRTRCSLRFFIHPAHGGVPPEEAAVDRQFPRSDKKLLSPDASAPTRCAALPLLTPSQAASHTVLGGVCPSAAASSSSVSRSAATPANKARTRPKWSSITSKRSSFCSASSVASTVTCASKRWLT